MKREAISRGRMRPFPPSAAVVVLVLSRVLCADAQSIAIPEREWNAERISTSKVLPPIAAWRHTASVGSIREPRLQAGRRISVPSIQLAVFPGSFRSGVNRQQPQQQGTERSTRSRVLGGIVGGVGGFFGGMFLGAAIEGDRCECDDPGLVGALIGAPVGGVAGAILGYKFLF